ncbi:hypothetical protein [Lapidilactobacillus wuchangensis]|uniref:hypothetical protein n=1 Tax=Lapidilactobacillus wuchangensis TaxID=2486001 RepID=UPI000F77259A|nr:hypothetical protein [Lapidilactobacillus wuchangensis]
MTKKIRKITQWILLLTLLLNVLMNVTSNRVYASDNQSYDMATREIPDGINPQKYMVLGRLKNPEYPDETMEYALNNSTKFRAIFDSNPTNIVKMTQFKDNYTRTIGTAWSTDNDFDYTQKQVFKLWLYFTDTTQLDGVKQVPGDGMAFVLQNDERGINTSANFSTMGSSYELYGPIGGQTLGVYGTNMSSDGNLDTLAKSAIQNSWALEFDTRKNALSGSPAYAPQPTGNHYGPNSIMDGSFDLNLSSITGEHIAASYPGEVSSYSRESVGRNYYYQLIHDVAKNANLTNAGNLTPNNNNWHHVTLTWNATSIGSIGNMNMTFDDKNIDGTSALPSLTGSYPVDTRIVDPNKTGKARWGITGSNSDGSRAESLFMIDATPTSVEGSATNTIYNSSRNQAIPKDSKEVGSNNDLAVTYKVSYDNDNASTDWTNLIAKLPIPAGTSFSSGFVSYSDDTSDESLTSGEITNNVLNHQLKNLSKSNKTATITLNLKANTVMANLNVPATTAQFVGDQYTAHTNTSAFTIVPANSITLTPNEASQQPLAVAVGGTSPDIAGNYTYFDKNGSLINAGSGFTNANFTMHVAINGANQPTYKVGDASAFGTFSLNQLQYAPSLLNDGKNTITYYVSDEQGNQSNKVTAEIYRVSGDLQIEASQSNFFETGKVNGQPQTLGRTASSDTNWNIRVIDGRTDINSGWTLQVKAGSMTDVDNSSKQLKGHIEYNGVDITKNTVEIKGTTESYVNNVTSVSTDWKADTGMQLKINANATAGSYSGEITWTLHNTP